MAEAFAKVRAAAAAADVRGARDQTERLRTLDPRRRRLLGLFRAQGAATAAEIAAHLGLSHRTIVDLCRAWVADGFLELADASRKNRAYRLTAVYEQLAASATPAARR